METYLVHAKATPTKGSKEYGTAGGAHVDIFLHSTSESKAELSAIDSLMNLYWTVEEVIFVLKITPERFQKLDTIAQEHYHLAQEHGISHFFAAWPVEDRDDNVIEVRELRDKDDSTSTKH